MNAVQSTLAWLQRGQQLSALVQELCSPMTSSQLWNRARVRAPRMRLRDASSGLRKLTVRGVVYCLNSGAGNGRAYFLTDFGRMLLEKGYGMRVAPMPRGMNWNRFAAVSRARVRRRILMEIGRPSLHGAGGKTTSEIRRNLRERGPVERNHAIRAIGELSSLKLIREDVPTQKSKKKLYVLTPAGRRIVEALHFIEPRSG